MLSTCSYSKGASESAERGRQHLCNPQPNSKLRFFATVAEKSSPPAQPCPSIAPEHVESDLEFSNPYFVQSSEEPRLHVCCDEADHTPFEPRGPSDASEREFYAETPNIDNRGTQEIEKHCLPNHPAEFGLITDVQNTNPIEDAILSHDFLRISEIAGKGFTSMVKDPLYAMALHQVEQMKRLLDLCDIAETAWHNHHSNLPDIRIDSRHTGYGQYMIRLSGVAKVELVNLMAVLTETRRFTEWFPYMRRVDVIHQFTPFTGVAKIVQSLGLPFISDRESIIQHMMMFDRSSGIMTLNVETCRGEAAILRAIPRNTSIPSANPRNVEVDLRTCGGFAEQIRPSMCYFRLFIHADVKMHLPGWIMRFLCKEIAAKAINSCLKLAGEEGSWHSDVKSGNPSFNEVELEVTRHINELQKSPGDYLPHTFKCKTYPPERWASDVAGLYSKHFGTLGARTLGAR